jgi:hypothetical protein
VASDGRVQHVDNIDPTFFDISLVNIPAERSAYGFVVDYIQRDTKEASWEKCAEEYLGVARNKEVATDYQQRISSILSNLASYEMAISDTEHPDLPLRYGFYGINSDIALGQKIGAMSTAHRYYGFRNLAEQGVLLSPESFAEAIGLEKSAGFEIRQASRGIYNDVYKKYADFSFDVPASVLHRIETAPFSKIAETYLPSHIFQSFKLDRESIIGSVARGVLASAKLASTLPLPQSKDIAEAYAIYKAASLCCFPSSLQEFGIRSAVLQTADIFGLVK